MPFNVASQQKELTCHCLSRYFDSQKAMDIILQNTMNFLRQTVRCVNLKQLFQGTALSKKIVENSEIIFKIG